MAEFLMPSLGADMESGTLVEWKVKPGDTVKRGDIVAVVATDKADIEVECYESGVVDRLVAQPGEKLPVGAVLALLHSPGEPPRVKASPLARRLAAERGVDLEKLKGSGPGGAIERQDVERAAAPQPPPPVQAPSGMRQAIAAAMAKSNREIPHYYVQTRIDMRAALDWLARENRQRPIQSRILPAALLLKAVARALAATPDLNAYWIEDRHQPKEAINIGVAISLRKGGLVTPAILHAEAKTVPEMMEALRDLITRAREGHMRGSEITEGTITVTNLGDLGVEAVYGLIYPPQVALVGFGKITEQPWAQNGMLGVRPVLTATLAADHRATDGRRGAQFLEALDRALQEPEKL